MAGRVAGKVAIVTGAGTGIGRGIAEMLAREGAAVVVANRSRETGEETARRITEAGGRAVFQPTDVSRETDCIAAVQRAVDAFGSLSILVNNAGIFPRATILNTTEELWDRILDTNLKGAFFMCKHAIPAMERAGGGSIVNIGSIHGLGGNGHLFPYAVSKGGLLTLTRNLAKAFAPKRIRANYVIPGWVITEGELRVQREEDGHDEEWLRSAQQRLPMGRAQTPEDAAWAVLYLASDEASQVTGCVINTDAGAAAWARGD